jgi:hypothetical protein
MTLNYRTMVERYPNLKEEVGGSNPSCEIPSLSDGNSPGGQLPHVLWRWHVDLLSQKRKENIIVMGLFGTKGRFTPRSRANSLCKRLETLTCDWPKGSNWPQPLYT